MTDTAPFDLFTFSVSKPGWGTSSLVIARLPTGSYELRLKRIERGASTEDRTREYALSEAASLDRWVHALGFYDEGTPRERVEGAGWWALKVSRNDGDELLRDGTAYPESFPDLLATMVGLGLPGIARGGEAAFLADFAASARPTGMAPSHLPAGLGIPGMDDALAELMKDPAKAESALRDQCRQLPASAKQEMLEFVRKNDPDHYEWWRRILLG